MKRMLFLMSLLTILACGLVADELGGEIVYLDGTVDVYRDGKQLDWRDVDIGFFVEPYDTIETGDDGIVEIDVRSAAGTGAMIKVRPGTSFYLTEEAVSGKKKSSFTMMKGSLAFRVQKLSGNEAFNVRTESAVMGVRGTAFSVESSPEGSILVLCDEGAVECSDPQGRSSMAQPGSVVEKVPETGLASFEVKADELELYRSYWLSKRLDIFKNGASTFIQGYMRQYRRLEPRFQQAYEDLSAQRGNLERYGKEGSSVSSSSLFQAKRTVSPAIIRMRSIVPLFEQVFARLEVLEEYHSQGIGSTQVNGISSQRFFSSFQQDSEQIKAQLADVRYLFKLFSLIDRASGGGASGLLGSPMSGSGSFGSGPPPSLLEGGF